MISNAPIKDNVTVRISYAVGDYATVVFESRDDGFQEIFVPVSMLRFFHGHEMI